MNYLFNYLCETQLHTFRAYINLIMNKKKEEYFIVAPVPSIFRNHTSKRKKFDSLSFEHRGRLQLHLHGVRARDVCRVVVSRGDVAEVDDPELDLRIGRAGRRVPHRARRREHALAHRLRVRVRVEPRELHLRDLLTKWCLITKS